MSSPSARFYVHKVVRAKGNGQGNYNLSVYEDELVRLDGKWYFTSRRYHTIYQDAPEYRGAVIGVPQLPDQIRRLTFNRDVIP